MNTQEFAQGYAQALRDVQDSIASLWPQGQYDRFNEFELSRRLKALNAVAAENADGWTLKNGGLKKAEAN
jgi:hypothetical protein